MLLQAESSKALILPRANASAASSRAHPKSQMTPLPQVDLHRIRQHEGSQHRAWEELCYQLVGDIERLPPATVLERRSPPDGGIEFSTSAPPGMGQARWAWQAKFLFRLDAAAFSQMTKSVEAALATTPDLERYAFVLPADRTSKELATWELNVTKWTAMAAKRRMEVVFCYLGHSQVLAALQNHAGAVRYFFDETHFTDEFFRQQIQREIDNLGSRYDPEVHVGLEVGEVLDAICRSPRYRLRLVEAFDEIILCTNALERARVPDDALLAAAVAAASRSARDLVAAFRAACDRITTPDSNVIKELESAAQSCGLLLSKLGERILELLIDLLPVTENATVRSREGQAASTVAKPETPEVEKQLHSLSETSRPLRRAIERTCGLLQSSVATRPALLVEGPAGCGKSHLVADIAKDRARSGMATLLLLGQHLTEGAIWPQVAQQIGLNLTGPELLESLDTAARVRRAGLALIVIDAINEGAGADLWQSRLAGFLSDIAKSPGIAVALTVRDTYTSVVIPPGLPEHVIARVTHRGFSGHEEEALARYTEHYAIRFPDIPPLLPEFTNPLLLRSLCESVKARGLAAIPREAQSLSWVFDGLIDAVNHRLACPKRLDVAPEDHLVNRTMKELANALLDADGEALPLAEARAICQQLHPEPRHSRSLLEGLITEGLLLREPRFDASKGAVEYTQQVRFTYQRLADHLRAEAMLDRYPESGQLAKAVIALAAGRRGWSKMGLIEALVLQVPERRGVELDNLVHPLLKRRRVTPQQGNARLATQGPGVQLGIELQRAFLRTLPWRAPKSITTETRELAKRYLGNGGNATSEWLSIRISLACVPDHPFNVLTLHEALLGMSMPQRDLQWSAAVLEFLEADGNPIARIIDWAWSGSGEPPADIVQLASTLLAWFLTSPNRRLRDGATKALLRLLEHRTRQLVDLLDRFAPVDDPYVMERLLAVACGHALRHRWLDPSQGLLEDLADLGRRVFDLVFGGPKVPEHLLARHYARTCVEVVDKALALHGRHLDRNLALASPPHGSGWPLTAPSLRHLAPHFRNRGTECRSVASLVGDDFQHYVIERGIAASFVMPKKTRRKAARRALTRRKLEALRQAIGAAAGPRKGPALLRAIDSCLDTELPDLARLLWDGLRVKASAQADLLCELESLAERIRVEGDQPVRLDSDQLGRWIARRSLDLGWTLERFGRQDLRLRDARASGWPETERFGKKYTWIAFDQLLGHLADHCTLQHGLDSPMANYEGPWQLEHAVEIDPTILVRGDRPPEGSAAARLRTLRIGRERADAWWLVNYNHRRNELAGSAEWLTDKEDISRPESLLTLRDPAGREWLVVKSDVAWDDVAADGSETSRRELWVQTRGYFMQLEDETRISRWAAERNWMGRWMPIPAEQPQGFLGAFPDLKPWCSVPMPAGYQRSSDAEGVAGAAWIIESHPGIAGAERLPCPIALATHGSNVVSDQDFSAIDIPRAILPSPLLLSLLQARWAGADTAPARSLGLGPVEAEYSWLASGELVAFASAGRQFGAPAMLCVRAEPLRRALAAAGLGMWSSVLAEKLYWTGPHQVSSDRTEVFGAATLAPSLALWGFTVEHIRWQSSRRTLQQRVIADRPLGKTRRDQDVRKRRSVVDAGTPPSRR